MKKLGILMIVLLLVGGFIFAEDEMTIEDRVAALEAQVGSGSLVPTVSGDATLTFGVDLNDPVAMGFKNAASGSIELTLVSGDASKGTIGVIALEGYEILIDDADGLTVSAPSVTGQLVFAPITVTIYSAPSLSGDNAAGFVWYGDDDPADLVSAALAAGNTSAAAGTAPGTGTISAVAAGGTAPTDGVQLNDPAAGDAYDIYWVPDAADAAEGASFQGLTVSVDVAPLTVDLLLASDGTWANLPRTADNINDFAFGANVTADIAPLAVNLGVFAGPTDGLDIALTAGADATVGPATVTVGVDGLMPNGGEFALDGKLVISATLGPATLGTHTYFWTSPDFDLDQEVSLDLSGAVEGLGFTETFQMVDVLSGAMAWNSATSVSYATGGIKPYADVVYFSTSQFDLTVGVELTGFVENTTFTLQYAAEDIANDNGAVTFATKIAY